MAKPTVTTFGAANTIEDLNTSLDAIADRFDGNIDGTDVSAIPWSKITVSGDIVNADINASAAIAGSKIAALGIDTAQLAANAVTIAKITNGTNFKLQVQAGTAAIAAGLNTTDTTLATISVSSAEDTNGKFLAIGHARFKRTAGDGEVILGIDINGTVHTPRTYTWVDGSGSAGSGSGFVIASGSATTSAIDVKLVAKGDGSVQFSHTSGEAELFIVTFNRIS